MNNFCGLDFGTSNSSMGFMRGHQVELTQFNHQAYIPSAIFFEFDEEDPYFGTEGIKRYIDGREGRMIWSPKNALGTTLVYEKTRIQNKSVSFKEVIGLIVNNIKIRCEAQSGMSLTNIVVGRPVFYNDKNKQLDDDAETFMREILMDVGFKNIAFEFEPIAAAAHYEQELLSEQLVLVVDMGGGTSDFTVAKLNKRETDRSKKILSIGGIHIAGTNFDKLLSLKSLMPELGMHAHYKTLEGKWSPIPPTLHKDLATWHKIGLVYNKQNSNYAREKIYTSDAPEKFERLLQTLEYRLGHTLAIAVEQAKIMLSSCDEVPLVIRVVDPVIDTTITKSTFNDAIQADVEKIIATLMGTIADAQIQSNQIGAVFMTGGASMIPLVRSAILSRLPSARLVEGDKFGSVATGLTLLASLKFGDH